MKTISKKDEYLTKIIHDLKTPTIAQIKALESFLVTCSNKISQEEVDLIKLTLSSCNYMHKLIDIFTSVHKLNYEKINLTYENFDIVKLAKDVCLELGILLKYRKLEYEFICPDEIMINADKLQLQRVIENIFSNCINHSFPNSKIIVYVFEKDNKLIFKVKNSSSYIKKEILSEIFEKFKTYPSAYNKAGVGLGLYLSKEIIKAHSGKIFAKSYPENINVFGFEIPI